MGTSYGNLRSTHHDAVWLKRRTLANGSLCHPLLHFKNWCGSCNQLLILIISSFRIIIISIPSDFTCITIVYVRIIHSSPPVWLRSLSFFPSIYPTSSQSFARSSCIHQTVWWLTGSLIWDKEFEERESRRSLHLSLCESHTHHLISERIRWRRVTVYISDFFLSIRSDLLVVTRILRILIT